MCGIAGIAGNMDAALRREKVERMTRSLAHRGPDAEGFFYADEVGLGHRRLCIIDLSEAANQPMTDVTGRYTIVYNGEVYNFGELREELAGYPFRTHCDTEVILAAYAHWGPACVERFNGMFAFAIWDAQEGSLFLVRDRLGIKPLYFSLQGGLCYFASELRALLHGAALPARLRVESLGCYLAYQAVHPPHTLIEGIEQLHPGEWAVFRQGRFQRHRYWLPRPQPPFEADPVRARARVRELLRQAVERRLIADVPLGAFLSGGIDSSAVVALMAEVSDRPVETFSVVFDEKPFDESTWSNLVARRFGTNHHPILLKPEDFLDSLPQALAAMDTPSGDAINTYVVSKVTRQAGVTVALSGLGGDELFMGYGPYLKAARLSRLPLFWHFPKSIRKGLVRLGGAFIKEHQREKLLEMAGSDSGAPEDILPAFRKVLTEHNLRRLGLPLPLPNGMVPQAGQLPVYSRLTLADLALYTQDVLLKDTDQMSMAHALEVRVPFFDHTLVEYVLGICDAVKHPEWPKRLLVEALGDLLPREIVFRPKQGFDLPWKVWMKGPLRTFCDERLKRLEERGLFDFDVPARMWRRFLACQNDNLWSRIWVLVVLEDWLERQGIE